jgi:hypothetical protein
VATSSKKNKSLASKVVAKASAKNKAQVSKRNNRSYRQMIGRIDLWSTFKVSLCFHTGAMLITVVATMVMFFVASSVGIVENIEKFLGTVVEIKDFSFLSFQVIQGILLVGFVMVALMTVITVISAALYNIFAEAVGGIEIYVVEETKSTKI